MILTQERSLSYGSLASTLDTIDPPAFLQWRDRR